MASVYRQDTGEFLGYLVDLYGPLLPGTKAWPFRAWRHLSGALRGEAEGPVIRAGRVAAPPHITLQMPVRNITEADVHLLVPPELLDFILTHSGFRAMAKPSAA